MPSLIKIKPIPDDRKFTDNEKKATFMLKYYIFKYKLIMKSRNNN